MPFSSAMQFSVAKMQHAIENRTVPVLPKYAFAMSDSETGLKTCRRGADVDAQRGRRYRIAGGRMCDER